MWNWNLVFVPNSLLTMSYPASFSVGIGKISAVCGLQYIWETELEPKPSVFVSAFSVFSRDFHQSLPSPATPRCTSAEVLTETARAQLVDLSHSFQAPSTNLPPTE